MTDIKAIARRILENGEYEISELKRRQPQTYLKFRKICENSNCPCLLYRYCPERLTIETIDETYIRLFGSKTDIQEQDILSLLKGN